MAGKVIACRCEDVTLDDLAHARALGYVHIEEAKRYTGLGTGPCQGKECMVLCALYLADADGESTTEIRPFTSRPPIQPVALGTLARAGDDDDDDGPGARHVSEGGPIASGPPKAETDVLIVGAGIMGLAIAYHLAMHGVTDVVVIDRDYLAAGASGRNGGGIRMQWSTATNVQLMRESMELCKRFAGDLGVNVWLRQGGYLFLARTDGERARMEKNVALQNRNGVRTRMLAPPDALRVVPQLDVSGIACACYNPRDGILFPWPFLWGYANQAAARGVSIHTFTKVTAIEPGPSGFQVTLERAGVPRKIRAQRVVNACGAWSPELSRLVGVTLPNHPHRHEILSTEPLKPFLGPMVSLLSSGLYFSQSMRGEIVTGVTVPDPDTHEVKLGSRLRFLTTLAREIVRVMPRLAQVKVLRQWAGPYDISPDGNPIVGEAPGVPGFHLACGFMGHGFMMAPVVSKYYGAWLAGGTKHELFERWRLGRFAEGVLETEEMIIG